MRLWTILSLFLVASAARGQEVDPRVEIVIQDGEAGRWRAPQSPEEIAARQTMERLLRQPELNRHVTDALRRMDRYHGNGVTGAMPLNTEGRLRIVLDMNVPASSGGAAVAFREGPGGALETYVMKGGRDLGMVRPETTPTMYRKTHEYMVHEFDHVGLVFAEFDHSARTGAPIQERMIFQADNIGHSFLTPSDTRGALKEGMAMALQLHHFPEETFLRRAVEQGHAEGSLWTAYRDGNGTPARRSLLQRLPFLGRYFPGPAVDPARVGLGMEGGRETPTLRTAAQLQTAEGVVALVLSDLYRENLTTPEQVRDIVNRSGVTDLDGLVREIRAQHGSSPQAARVEALRARRFLGADLNYEAARRLYEQRLAGQLTPEAYARQVDALVTREVRARTGHSVDLRQAPRPPPIADGHVEYQARVREERARARAAASAAAGTADDAARASREAPRAAGAGTADDAARVAASDDGHTARPTNGGLAGARASLGFDFRQGGIFVAPVITGTMTLWESMQKGEDFGQALRHTGRVLASPEFLAGNLLAGSAGAALGSAIPLPARLVGPGLLRGMAGATPAMAGAIVASKLGMGLVSQIRQGRIDLGALVTGVDWGLTAAEIAGTVIGMSLASALAGPALLAATTLGPFALIPIAGAILGGIAAERLLTAWRQRGRHRPLPARVHAAARAEVLGTPLPGS